MLTTNKSRVNAVNPNGNNPNGNNLMVARIGDPGTTLNL